MILLGVTGSIAAYKAVEVLRGLVKAGHDVRVAMTHGATQFIGPLTFQALSGHPVVTSALDSQGWQMAHLALPEKASAVLVAPASAECLSQLARGAAGDIVSASVLAVPRDAAGQLTCPVFIAPAMHEVMWFHPATRANVQILQGYGYQFIGPVKGPLGRTGDAGEGRFEDPQTIVTRVLSHVAKK